MNALLQIATRGVLEATSVEFDFFHTCSVDIAVFALLVGFSEWRPREVRGVAMWYLYASVGVHRVCVCNTFMSMYVSVGLY